MKNFISGVLVGVANIIPGVSGGTIIVILGMFDKLMQSISDVFKLNISKKKRIEAIKFLFTFIIGFENKQAIIEFLPSKMQKNTRELLTEIDQACRSFVTGSILDCTFIFMISSIGLWFVGLKAPLLFGLFSCFT